MYGEGVMEVMVVKINKRFRAVKEKLHFFDLKWRPNGDLCWVHRRFVFNNNENLVVSTERTRFRIDQTYG
jgi:uncharacterized protein YxjI